MKAYSIVNLWLIHLMLCIKYLDMSSCSHRDMLMPKYEEIVVHIDSQEADIGHEFLLTRVESCHVHQCNASIIEQSFQLHLLYKSVNDNTNESLFIVTCLWYIHGTRYA